jgi:hypothetical protein
MLIDQANNQAEMQTPRPKSRRRNPIVLPGNIKQDCPDIVGKSN